jgi:hypothetical protein
MPRPLESVFFYKVNKVNKKISKLRPKKLRLERQKGRERERDINQMPAQDVLQRLQQTKCLSLKLSEIFNTQTFKFVTSGTLT